jgi:hypothetical protein
MAKPEKEVGSTQLHLERRSFEGANTRGSELIPVLKAL